MSHETANGLLQKSKRKTEEQELSPNNFFIMSSYLQYFKDGEETVIFGCLDDFFWHHEYGYIKLKDVSEWYNLSTDKNWKNRVLSENTFHDAVKGLERIRPEPKTPKKKKEKTNPSVEEVEEKPQFYVWDIDITTGKPFKSGSTAQVYSTVEPPSIFEKLREELERRIENYERENSSYYNQRQFEASAILDLLTSLEQTKEEPVANPSLPTANSWQAKIKGVQPQFTPWQEIEVSNDEIEWYPYKYKWLSNDKLYPISVYNGGLYKFARPIDKIEPELPSVPDYKANRIATDGRHVLAYPNKLEVQVELLTTFCQSLSRQKTTK